MLKSLMAWHTRNPMCVCVCVCVCVYFVCVCVCVCVCVWFENGSDFEVCWY